MTTHYNVSIISACSTVTIKSKKHKNINNIVLDKGNNMGSNTQGEYIDISLRISVNYNIIIVCKYGFLNVNWINVLMNLIVEENM